MLVLVIVIFVFTPGVSAQGVKRQSIGSLGASFVNNHVYHYECAGQPYYGAALTTDMCVRPGFVQPISPLVFHSNTLMQIKVYPNPVEGELQVEWIETSMPASIRVYSVQGVVVHEFHELFKNSFTIDLEDQPAGMYILEMHQNNQYSRTVIIKN